MTDGARAPPTGLHRAWGPARCGEVPNGAADPGGQWVGLQERPPPHVLHPAQPLLFSAFYIEVLPKIPLGFGEDETDVCDESLKERVCLRRGRGRLRGPQITKAFRRPLRNAGSYREAEPDARELLSSPCSRVSGCSLPRVPPPALLCVHYWALVITVGCPHCSSVSSLVPLLSLHVSQKSHLSSTDTTQSPP